MSGDRTSTDRPLIGLSGRRKKGVQIVNTHPAFHDYDGDFYYADYARGVFEAGGLPVHLPLDVDPALFVERLDGIVLTGGADVDPERYGSTADEHSEALEVIRDDFEIAVLDAAAAVEAPVLAICRGLQVLNVFAGGTLHQHVPEHSCYDDGPATTVHPVDISPGSGLERLYGSTHLVNSLHHQTVDRLGDDLVVTATHEDTIEGIEHTSLPILAVQWHPELLPTRSTDPVFGWIVEQASSNS